MGLSDLLGDVYGEEPEDERPSDAPLALDEITLAPPPPPVAEAPPSPFAPAPAPPPPVAEAPPSPFAPAPVAPPPPTTATPPPAPPPSITTPTPVAMDSTPPLITAAEPAQDPGLVEPRAESSLLGDVTPPGGVETGILPEWSSDEALDVAFSDWEPTDAAEDFASGPTAGEALMAHEAAHAPEPSSKRRGRFSRGGRHREKKAPATTRQEPEDDVMDRPESVERSSEPALGLDAGTLDLLPRLDTDSELAMEALLGPGPEAEDEAPSRGGHRRGLRKNKKERGATSRKAPPAPEAAAHEVAQTSSSSAVALLDDDLLPNKRKR